MLKKFRVLLIIASLVVTFCVMSNTYSKYVASSEGNVAMEFARWQLLVNEADITNKTTANFDLNPVIIKNNNVADNKVAPSSEGYFDIEINPKNVDVSFEYTIDLSMTDAIDDLMITRYAFLPDNYVEEDALEYVYLNGINTSITESIEYGKAEVMKEEKITNEDGEEITVKYFKPIKIRVFFEWIEGTVEYTNDTTKEIENTIIETMDDEKDTEVGVNAANDINSTFEINANISFEQIIA